MKLARARLIVHRIPIAAPVRTSFGTMLDRPSCLVSIEDDEGCAGWGEVWCNYPSVGAEHRARLLESTILPLALSMKAGPVGLWHALNARLHVLALQTGEWGPIAQCLAGLDCALNDLQARRAGLPLHRFLGAQSRPEVGVYASGINPTGAGETAARAIAAGYTACKIKIGFDPDVDRRNLLEAREAIGEAHALMADANQAWDVERAVHLRDALDAARLEWLEEPIPHDRPDEEWCRLADALKTPLAAGENFAAPDEFRDLPHRRRLRFLQPDLGKWGGVSQTMGVMKEAAATGVTVCPHWLGGGVGLLASLHCKAASGEDGAVEVDFNTNPMRENVTRSVFDTLRQGSVRLGGEPGIGPVDEVLGDFSRFVTYEARVEAA